jgi:glycyl-tRNA synthetase beta chain
MSKNLLVELLVEELPPKSLKQLGNSFAELLTASLKAQDLMRTTQRRSQPYASPRRSGGAYRPCGSTSRR